MQKVRVLLLDADTGEVLDEADVYTSADCVTFADGLTLEGARAAGLLNGEPGQPGGPGRPGEDGEDGKDGDPGKDGVSPIITTGKIQITPAGGPASVENVGTPSAARFDFVIPADPTVLVDAHAARKDNPHKADKAQIGLGNVDNVRQASQAEFEAHNADETRHLTEEERQSWTDKYTRNEVDNKLASLETAIDWKESVGTLADIGTAYPDPQDGWTVNVRDTDYTYRYSGTEWIAISANAVPKATQELDGLLSREDKTALDDAAAKRHVHDNRSVLDGITAALINGWNSAVTHISDAVRHITAAERSLWNTVGNKVDKETGKGLSANDYTTTEKNKLAGIAAGANAYAHPSSHPASMITGLAVVATSGKYSDLTDKPMLPGELPPSGIAGGDLSGTYPNPEVRDNSHNHTIANVTGLQNAIDGKAAASHSHAKAQITDFPASLPANGGNAATVNGLTVLTAVPAGAKFTDTIYAHPASHPASMITGLPTSLPANGGAAATAAKLQTARTINGVAFDGSANITIADSTKAPLASPALTGTPTAPTPAAATNSTQIATTAYVKSQGYATTSQLATAGGFDFDNLAALKGYTYSYTVSDTETAKTYTESIKLTSTGAVYATRTTTKTLATGDWTERTVCAARGVDSTITYTKQSDGTWKGVVT